MACSATEVYEAAFCQHYYFFAIYVIQVYLWLDGILGFAVVIVQPWYVYFDIEGTDKLPEYRLLPESVEVGETLAMLNCGAYSLAQMFPYNGRPLPAAVLVRENGEVELIRKRDSYELLIESDIWWFF